MFKVSKGSKRIKKGLQAEKRLRKYSPGVGGREDQRKRKKYLLKIPLLVILIVFSKDILLLNFPLSVDIFLIFYFKIPKERERENEKKKEKEQEREREREKKHKS